ncbi:MAG: ThuA domain-containing protein [Armatimonadetes bacterium]|nr:ThuA domain-containing protein [Armatimonadota bacterium]
MPAGLRVFVFSRTTGFRHGSIDAGKKMFRELAAENDWLATFSENPEDIREGILRGFDAVVFLNTTGDILDDAQQKEFELYIRKGGGFLGIHSAADTEYGWEWYGGLVGGYFKGHPAVQDAKVMVVDREHPATKFLPEVWVRKDEWYDYRAIPAEGVRILARLDTGSYNGHTMGDDHPIMWCHEYEGGRAFYTGFGHTNESYSDPMFRRLITQAIVWLAEAKKQVPCGVLRPTT